MAALLEGTWKLNRTLRLLAVNVTLFVIFVLVMNVPMTGIPAHEWLGIGIGVFVIVHVLQHTNWIVTTTKRLFSSTSFRNRLSYLTSIGMFIGFISIIVSGLVISQVALPGLGITPSQSEFWMWLHLSSVAWVLWLTAIHIALGWKWIVTTVKRYAGSFRPSAGASQPSSGASRRPVGSPR